MVLEEQLLFNEKEDAEHYVHFLKGRKCPARMNIQGSIQDELLLEGRLGGFFELLEYLESTHPGADDDDDDDDDDDSFDDDLLEDDDVDEQGIPIRVLLSIMKDELERMWDYISGIMVRNQPGDILFTSDELNAQLLDMVSSVEVSEKEIPRPAFFDFVRNLNDIQCLEQNGLVEEAVGGIVLKKKIDPADLIITRPLMTPDEEDDEEIRPFGLVHLMDTHYDTRYILTIDPKLLFSFTPFELAESLVDLSFDEDSRSDLLRHVSLKQQLIHILLGLIGDAKVISLDELVRLMGYYKKDPTGEEELTGFHVTFEYLEALIDDLRRLRVVQGNNDRIRLTNQKWVVPGQ